MKTTPKRISLLAGASALALACTVQASVIHRYSFNETSGTTADDSVGTANGELKGNGAYFGGDGKLYLPGGTSSAADAASIAGYVDLPNHMFNVLTNLTIETWVTWEGSGSAWQRVFDFGTSAGGEDVSNGNGTYLFMSPQGDANLRFAIRDIATGTEPTQLTSAAPLATGEEVCLTVTYDYTANVARLYSNAVLVAFGPAAVDLKTVDDVNNWLGRSQWGDPVFWGEYNEFRVYDGALNPVEVAASYVSGTETPSTDVSKLGALQAVHLSVGATTMTELDTQTAVPTVDYANLSGIRLIGVPGADMISDNPAVLTISPTGGITALKPGTANLTLSYQGKTDVVAMTVNARQLGVVVAGTLYVDLRAADAATDVNTWANRASAADPFLAVGTPTYVADVDGTGVPAVQFNGTTDAYLGPFTTPDLDDGSDRSIEVWAYNPAVADEETLVAMGHRGGPDGTNLSFNYGANTAYGAVGHWGSADMGWTGFPAAGQWHYLVYTYDGVNTAKVYADGKLKTTRVIAAGLNTYAEQPIRIAAQGNNSGSDFDFGQALSGSIALVRVHGGKLSDTDVANNYLYGPTLTPPGDLQSISLALTAETLYGSNYVAQGSVTATFANKTFDVNGFATFSSSDDTVATVDATGRIVARNLGVATITAAYNGKQDAKQVTVVAPPALALKHRYSFSEAAGVTTTKDAVGTADGTLKGLGADFDGAGKLMLPGLTSSAADPATISGYVDLPNHIINTLVNVSFEAWVSWEGSGAWQRIFDFGTSAGGEDISNGNGSYLFMSPQGDVNLRFAVRDPLTGAEPTQLTSTAPLATGQEVYVAATYDFTRNVAVLYSNAVQVATGTATVPLSSINDVNNWLGRSQWPDNMFQGTFNEFRIWEGALPADQVASDYAAGPDTVPTPVQSPELGIARSGSNVLITWPNTAAGFALEVTPALGGTWSTVDISGAADQGGKKVLTVPIGSANQFYRMKK